MLTEVLTTITSLALKLFVISSILAMEMSLDGTQIMVPLRDMRLVDLLLLGHAVPVSALAMPRPWS